MSKFEKFMQEGCGCHQGSTGGQCCNNVLRATGLKNLYNCLELSHVELDLVILTNIQGFTPLEAMAGEKRKKNPPYSFQYQARPICKEMFLNLYGISKSCFQKLLDHYQNHGLSVRIHGNSRRLPHNTLPQAVV